MSNVSRANGTRARRALLLPGFLATLLALVVTTGPVLAATATGADQAAFARVRAATAAYHDLTVATSAGYALFPGCFSDPSGGMGVHYVDFGSVGDGSVDPLNPEALVYEPIAGGGMRLVAVEYVMIAASWHGQGFPTVLGHPLTFVASPNEFGLPDFYELHVWLWQPNPLGMFNEWNPSVACPAG